jgi:hypothetical protein
VPSDTAFQRWHPIDWGFYPFSVPEFTENIMRNHVILQKTPMNLKSIEKELTLPTLGGESVVFRNHRECTFSCQITFSYENSNLISNSSDAVSQQRADRVERNIVKWK